MATKQRTFYVGDEKIQIKSRPKLWHNNPNGFAVSINEKQYHCNFLTRKEAEDYAYVRWVKEWSGQALKRTTEFRGQYDLPAGVHLNW